MSITVDWMDARYSVIHANFVDHWNWSELYTALEACHMLMARSHNDIMLMLDFIGSNKVSATSTLFVASDSMDVPQKITRIVLVTDNQTLGKKMLTLLKDIYPEVGDIILTHSHQSAFECVRSTIEMPALN